MYPAAFWIPFQTCFLCSLAPRLTGEVTSSHAHLMFMLPLIDLLVLLGLGASRTAQRVRAQVVGLVPPSCFFVFFVFEWHGNELSSKPSQQLGGQDAPDSSD